MVYGITLAVVVVWSLIETRADLAQLAPRILIPIIIGGYLFQQKTRASLV